MRYCVGVNMAVDWEDEASQPGWDRRLLRRALSYFVPYWRHGLAALACIAVGALLGLVPALVMKRLIDYLAQPGGHFSHLLLLVAVGLGGALAGGLIGVAESYLSTTISQGIRADLSNQLFAGLLRQPVSFFTRNRSGDILSRLTNDVGGIDSVVADTIFGLVTNLIILPTTLALMIALDWRMTVVALLGFPLAALPSRRVGEATFQARKRTQEKFAELMAHVQEVLGISGFLLVKAFGRERAERARVGGLVDDLRRLTLRQAMIGRWFHMVMETLETAAPAVLLLFGGYLVLEGEASVGTVITFLTLLIGRLYGAIGSLGSMHVNVIGSLALFQRLFAYIDRPPEVADAPDARELGEVRGAIRFERVTFAYDPKARTALEDVSFAIEPGQLVALVGPTGAGKTTVTSLVPRFYDPQVGSVRVDGHDVRDVTLESLGRQVGIVFQETFLFHASVRDNLRYARPDATDAELEAAARAAYIHDVIDALPDRYDTLVGERGHRLSGGERQRVALARVILKDPRILILDEATSNLDSVSEQLIQAALKPLFLGRTSLVIAHRLSTILAADLILVLDQGHLVEQGTHAELLRLGGLYALLYERQFRPLEVAADQLSLV